MFFSPKTQICLKIIHQNCVDVATCDIKTPSGHPCKGERGGGGTMAAPSLSPPIYDTHTCCPAWSVSPLWMTVDSIDVVFLQETRANKWSINVVESPNIYTITCRIFSKIQSPFTLPQDHTLCRTTDKPTRPEIKQRGEEKGCKNRWG